MQHASRVASVTKLRYQAIQPPICLYQVSKYPRKDAFEVYVMLKEKERLFAREVVFSRHRCHRSRYCPLTLHCLLSLELIVLDAIVNEAIIVFLC